MSESTSQQYFALIDEIVNITLQGKIRSLEQIKQILTKKVTSGTGEIFERCLQERINSTNAELEKKLKATRILRALQTIQGEWEKYQKENQTKDAIADVTREILAAQPSQRLLILLKLIDSNPAPVFNREQLTKLGESLKLAIPSTKDIQSAENLQQLVIGITEGLKSFNRIEIDFISWIYEQNQSQLGLAQQKNGPWAFWAKKLNNPAKELFTILDQSQSLAVVEKFAHSLELSAWLELAILLQNLQKALVTWFAQQPYDAKMGKKLVHSVYLIWATIWCQLFRGFDGNQDQLRQASFQMMLQTLRLFAQQDDFPLYGGVFISFSGQYLRDTLEYFAQPLQEIEATKEKARILTLLGYSQMVLGQYQRAQSFYAQALESARQVQDNLCEIAALNHLARSYINLKDYTQAINYSQRALILSRQLGDNLGFANASVNLGYSEIFSARQAESLDLEDYDGAISYLERGLKLADKLGDRQSQALGYNSLGIAYVMLGRSEEAISTLEKGIEFAVYAGDVYLQGLNFFYLAQAYYGRGNLEKTVSNGCLGMYLLEQINGQQWRQIASFLTIIREGIGEDVFTNLLKQQRPKIISFIGIDGYDYLPELLKKS